MKKSFLCLVALALGVVMSASRVDAAACTGFPVNVNPGGNTTSIGCSVGPVTFSNFAYVDATNDPGPVVSLTSTQFIPGTSWGITLNPNLTGTPPQDIHLVFEVTSTVALSVVDLFNGGSPLSTIQERVCTGGVSLATGACTGTQLANISATAGQTSASASFTPSETLWIWKDIGTSANGSISSFTQNFLATPTPEPLSMALLGGGLFALGLARWRRSAKN
jgi:hypothetical protein